MSCIPRAQPGAVRPGRGALAVRMEELLESLPVGLVGSRVVGTDAERPLGIGDAVPLAVALSPRRWPCSTQSAWSGRRGGSPRPRMGWRWAELGAVIAPAHLEVIECHCPGLGCSGARRTGARRRGARRPGGRRGGWRHRRVRHRSGRRVRRRSVVSARDGGAAHRTPRWTTEKQVSTWILIGRSINRRLGHCPWR